MKKILELSVILIDLLTFPLTIISGIWLKLIRKYNIGFWNTKSTISKSILHAIGVFPIIDHYYEPFFGQKKYLNKSLREDRALPGIDWNVSEQLELLNEFKYNNELIEFEKLPNSELNYSFEKANAFNSGDSEILYSMVRYFQPKKIIEIGCGHSSLIIQQAINNNEHIENFYSCKHICVEPFENKWLSKLNIQLIREKVEKIDINFFKSLKKNDILFIDSTHIIRPQGDVLFELLYILPELNPGVIIHIHDIFSPKDYLNEWIIDGINFWNEQYLLEAFMSFNNSFKIICAVNYLKHKYYNQLTAKCPFLTQSREPGSFWIKKIN